MSGSSCKSPGSPESTLACNIICRCQLYRIKGNLIFMFCNVIHIVKVRKLANNFHISKYCANMQPSTSFKNVGNFPKCLLNNASL